jgi:PAS domain S-box-containing protein
VREQDAVLQNAVTGIIFVKDRRIVRCNRRFEEIFGYAQGELLRQVDALHVRSQEDYEAGGETLYEPLWRGETVYAERRHVREGRQRHLVLAFRPRGATGRSGARLGLAVRRHHAGARVRRSACSARSPSRS